MMAGEIETVLANNEPLGSAKLSGRDALATEYRAYGREISVVCLFTCLLGVLALAVAYFGQFNLGISTPGSATLVSQGHSVSVSQSRVEFTSLIVGFSATCFAATLVVFGGSIAQLQRMLPATAWMIGLTAAISAAGLLFLTFG